MPRGLSESAAKDQRGGAVKSFFIFVVFVGVLALVALGAGGYAAYREAVRPGPLAAEQVVLLESGMTVSQIAEQLEAAGALRRPELFKA
ncbi:MAG: hypothetical protein AAGJ87_16380, partial [Pseudomonadota bacterium]